MPDRMKRHSWEYLLALAAAAALAPATLAPATVAAGEPEPGAKPVAAARALPKRCAADSPVDQACESYGGTYLITLGPAESGADKACVVSRTVTAKVVLDGSVAYSGRGAGHELDALGKTLGVKKPDHTVGAAVRKGVCCVDLEVRDDAGVGRVVQIHLARGASIVSAKAHDWTGVKDCEGQPSVDVRLVK